MTREELGIISLLSYVELFDYPLKESEIFSYYFGDPSAGNLDRKIIKESLDYLVGQGILSRDSSAGFYFFPDKSYTVETRLEREESSRKILLKVRKISRLLAFLPWVRFIGVTGALSSLNSPPDDDADLIIITAHNRLWLARLIAFLALKILRLKKGQKRIRGRNAICVNVWMDEQYLDVNPQDRDLVVAYDIIRIKPLIDKDGLLEKFINTNSWIRNFFPLFQENDSAKRSRGEPLSFTFFSRRRDIFYPLKVIFDLLEIIAYKIQLRLIKKNFPDNLNIKESPFHLWQHPSDNRGKTLVRYGENLNRRLSGWDQPLDNGQKSIDNNI